jgi:hypothetical protein
MHKSALFLLQQRDRQHGTCLIKYLLKRLRTPLLTSPPAALSLAVKAESSRFAKAEDA